MSARMLSRPDRLAGALVAVWVCGSGLAAAATSIHADTAAGLGLGTTVTVNKSTYTISNGTLVGTNLFESFSDFSLAAGDTAKWTYTAGTAASITNVINRVTGGAPSQISGALNSTALSHANFYFINPAGVVFGAGASVNVAGAAHFSTASQLAFADGAVFTAATPSGSTLTMSAPSAFGFLGGEGDISITGVKGGGFNKATGGTSLVGADIQVSGSSLQFTRLDLIAVGDQALSVPVTDPLSASGFSGALKIDASTLLALSPASAGATVDIGAGAASLTGGSQVQAIAPKGQDGGSLLAAVQSLAMDHGALSTSSASTGNAGDIDVSAASGIQLADQSSIASAASSQGSAGSVNLSSQSLSLTASTVRSSGQFGSVGQSGAINLTVADALTTQSAFIGTINSGVSTPPISISAKSLSMAATTLESQPANGAAGPITIDVAGPVAMTAGTFVSSGSNNAAGVATAGAVTVNAQSLVLSNTDIEAFSHGNVVAAPVTFNVAGGVSLNDNSLVESGAVTGSTSPITIDAQTLAINASGIISAPAVAGPGGAIYIDVSGAVTLTGQGANPSIVHSTSRGAADTGLAGPIDIKAQSLTVNNGTIAANATGAISSGPVNVNVTGAIDLVNNGGIFAQAFGSGAGGSLTLNSKSLLVDNGQLISSTSGSGAAGSVNIFTGSVLIKDLGVIHSASNFSGSGASGDVVIRASDVTLNTRAEIFTSSASSNAGGNISIGNLDGSSVVTIDGHNTAVESSNTAQGGGSGGDIQVYASRLVVSNGGQIHTDASAGKAGSIELDFPHGGLMFVEGQRQPGIITTNSASTEAGVININNPSAIILNGSDIEAQGPARGAFVTINSPAVIQSSDHENKFIVTGVVTLEGEYVDIAGSVTLSGLTFIDASKVLRGQCAALVSSGETSRLTDTLKGPFGPAGDKPAAARRLAWRTSPPSACGGPALGQN